ncbi:DNA-directed DNA polymerase [Caerostris extrusa]|uniref:DNA-directed DNA polymerase n=1 Tax=Caerostris extrusa TaxID=172846 RepID=A0AAV4P8L2_CAEEX|nr:DNA-directed DNA polymerase [Caerostris extrusa]
MQMGLKKMFNGYSACENFLCMAVYSEHKGFTAIAHNMKGPFLKPDFDSPDSMGPAVREKFLIWYEDQKNKTFNFQEEMVIYCRYVTIASACMAVFRSLHVTPNTIAMVPIHELRQRYQILTRFYSMA